MATIMWRNSSPVILAALCLIHVMVYTTAVTEYNLRKTSFTKWESEGHVIITIGRTGDISGRSSVLVQTIPGTAASPADYVVLNQRREFIENSQLLTVRIDLVDDTIREDEEMFQVQISEPSIGMTLLANITILDDDAQFSFQRSFYQVDESVGSVSIAVVREGYANRAVDVYVSTSGADPNNEGRATPGSDFIPLQEARLQFQQGEDTVTLQIAIIPDQVPELTESFDVWIVRVKVGETGLINTTRVSIIDDDVQYEIVEESFSAKESTSPTQISVTITRKFNLQLTGSVEVFTEDGTARSSDGDYVPIQSRVDFPMGMNTAITTLTIQDDNVYEPQGEVFYVGIRNPQPVGFVLASASRRMVTIEDNESLISLASTSYTVTESDESITIQVRRTGDLSLRSTVRLRLIAISATADTDYTDFNDVLTFESNQQTVDVRIAIVNDEISGEEDEVFMAELSQVTVSVLNPNATRARITIQDSPRLSTLAIVLIAVGGTAFILIIIIMILCCCAFMGSSKPREPFYYDRGHHNVPGVDFPQESSGRDAVVTYIPDDMDDRRHRDVDERQHDHQDRPRRSERHSERQIVENGGPRASEVNERDHPLHRESNRSSTEQPQAVLAQERPRDGRNREPVDRHVEQSDPRRVRSMFNPRAERDPYWGKARHSYHASPNHYGYF